MSQIVFHRPYRRQRQHSNVIFKIRQTDRGCIWRACMLPPLSTSAQCGETIHLQQIRHLFFFSHQRTEFHQLRSGRGHSWEERKLYKTVFEYFFRAVSWREADEFSSKQIFQNLTPESVSPHLPPSTTQLSILIPCSPQSVYFPPVQNICLFLSFSVSLTVSFSFRLACFGWDDLYFLLFSALWMEGRGGGAKPKIIVKALLKWVVSCYFVPREREKPFIIA